MVTIAPVAKTEDTINRTGRPLSAHHRSQAVRLFMYRSSIFDAEDGWRAESAPSSGCPVGDAHHITCVRIRCTVDSTQMGRLSKSVFLVVLLLLAGVPGYAARLCDMPSSSHAHACCMGHDQQTAPLIGTTNTASWGLSCRCRVAPLGSATIPSLSPSVRSYEGTHGTPVTYAAALDLPLPVTRSNRGSPHSVTLRHSPFHALLCTFLV
jgi:hypothetical protein